MQLATIILVQSAVAAVFITTESDEQFRQQALRSALVRATITQA